jgi:hypothetical protein
MALQTGILLSIQSLPNRLRLLKSYSAAQIEKTCKERLEEGRQIQRASLAMIGYLVCLWSREAKPHHGLPGLLARFDLPLWAEVAVATILPLLAAHWFPEPRARAALSGAVENRADAWRFPASSQELKAWRCWRAVRTSRCLLLIRVQGRSAQLAVGHHESGTAF